MTTTSDHVAAVGQTVELVVRLAHDYTRSHTAGIGTDDGAGHEAGFVTSNPRTSLSGRLDGRRPELRIRRRQRIKHG